MLHVAADPLASARRMLRAMSPRERIDAAEREMLRYPQAECPVVHRFGPGLYIRELSMPAGTLAMGHRQRFEQMNVFLKGRVRMFNDDGSATELAAPMMFVGPPGRKLGLVLEDVVWLNIYPTSETDVEKLEEMYLDKSDGWREQSACHAAGLRALAGPDHSADYRAALAEFGFDEATARAQSENAGDMIAFPHGGYSVQVSTSPIEGKGLFATARFSAGDVIAPARIGAMRTIAGRYTNHSATPNAKMMMRDGCIDLVATTDICGCRGGHLGDEITIDYRQALGLQIQRKDAP